MEILGKRFSIDYDFPGACPNVDDGCGRLTFSEAPSFSFAVQFGLPLLLGKGSAEVKQVDTVELCEVVGVYGAGIACGKCRVVNLICKLA